MVAKPSFEDNCLAPTSEGELSDLVAESARSGTQLRVIGGGTRLEPMSLASGHKAVSTRLISGIVDYEPGALTLVARAGTPLHQIETLLEGEGQILAFEPMDHRHLLETTGTPTVGGMVGANVCGPRRLFAGACRDHLLGVRFVDGSGRVVKNGGRVMKNVTGLDLSKLICGSFGTLGITTEVSFKTAPASEREETLVFSDVTTSEASAIFATALATPFEISGAAYIQRTATIRIQGFSQQIAYRRERLKELFNNYSIDVFEGEQSRQHWMDIRDVRHFAATEHPVWQILVRPTDAPDVVSGLERLGGTTSLDWGGGLIWYNGEAPAADVRRVCGRGHAKAVRGATLGPKSFFPPENEFVSRVSQSLRTAFDPAGILNPDLLDR
ncbi:FAD-binding protein [Rhizobium leguminosarum]|uniref:FAD-binding protein n=1 Tax=Rhizobium leguminosarum TaxID=384 RepID=UPI00098F2B60|nr:FAD-binding protein [Rhizobium leguminosarum]ASS58023.1 FAD-binding protein [Rhizobium leguminosarum bv. viciae]MBB4560710.1 glycolate oxidase FAD binding subunit [Rhizobium leguminosarum]MBY5484997.1 FAD-binding protein [Rhizobium leguminosarum]MDX6006431.1 FAD-binding protein [Rhizobium leguminosarum]NKK14201.1 FAD-binding protein [Rhizobium leguminosarum bv. viciae]